MTNIFYLMAITNTFNKDLETFLVEKMKEKDLSNLSFLIIFFLKKIKNSFTYKINCNNRKKYIFKIFFSSSKNYSPFYKLFFMSILREISEFSA